MGKTWVANTTANPKQIDGRLVLPGDGVFVDDGAPQQLRLPVTAVDDPGALPVLEIAGDRYGLLPEAAAAAARALVSEAWMSPALQALLGYAPTRIYLDETPLWLDNSPIFN